MTTMSKKELISTIKSRYLKASKKDKGKILDEFCGNTEYNRKYAIKILQAGYDHNRLKNLGRKPRKKIYTQETMMMVIKVWELLEFPCGQRLRPSLVPLIDALERCHELQVSDEVKNQLQKISAKTLDSRLKKERSIRRLKRNRGATRHGSLLKSSIPIRITDWDTSRVGFMEIDTVANNGGDPSGEFIYSLDLVEIFSGWSEQIAVLGKGERGIVTAINQTKLDIPFDLLGLDSDSGGEFINWHLVKYCDQNKLFFTRSRPDRKNDNAYVEQKNNTHIRQWLGYGRYDSQKQLNLINDLYRNELRLFNNFFRPVMKITSREKINNSVCRKRYDIAKTPCQRLIESKQISKKQKQELNRIYLSLNPVELKKTIEQKIKKIKESQSKKLYVPTVGTKVTFLDD